jgi:hypothetical protein
LAAKWAMLSCDDDVCIFFVETCRMPSLSNSYIHMSACPHAACRHVTCQHLTRTCKHLKCPHVCTYTCPSFLCFFSC